MSSYGMVEVEAAGIKPPAIARGVLSALSTLLSAAGAPWSGRHRGDIRYKTLQMAGLSPKAPHQCPGQAASRRHILAIRCQNLRGPRLWTVHSSKRRKERLAFGASLRCVPLAALPLVGLGPMAESPLPGT